MSKDARLIQGQLLSRYRHNKIRLIGQEVSPQSHGEGRTNGPAPPSGVMVPSLALIG